MRAKTETQQISELVPGQDLGASDWLRVDQDMVSGFGEITLDRDPMHIDPDWASDGPFGGTIAFGHLTISLTSILLHNVLGTDPARHDPSRGYYLNYGFDRVRLVTPVPVGSRIRGRFKVADVRLDKKDRTIVTFDVEIDVEGEERIAMFAEWLVIWVYPSR